MDVREELVEIIQNSVGGCAKHWAEVIADGLIAHGVTVQIPKEEKPFTDLTNKCGSCIYSEVAENVFGKSKCYVRCTNKEHLNRRRYQEHPIKAVRQRTTKGCKRYAPQPKPPKEEA